LPAHVTNAFRLLREVAHPLLTFPGDAGYDVEPSPCKAAPAAQRPGFVHDQACGTDGALT
jgi:hypothetical protein